MAIKETTRFLTSDGMNYADREMAEEHEKRYQKQKHVDDLYKHLDEVCIWCVNDEWTGLAGYFGGEASTIYIADVDEQIAELASLNKYTSEDLSDRIGERVILRRSSDDEIECEYTLEDAIESMKESLEELKSFRKEVKK